jgi:hypothetical protein
MLVKSINIHSRKMGMFRFADFKNYQKWDCGGSLNGFDNYTWSINKA